MKRTKYFTSEKMDHNQLEAAINDAERKRNTFLDDTDNTVGEIEREQIQIVTLPSGYYQAVISVTYFPK